MLLACRLHRTLISLLNVDEFVYRPFYSKTVVALLFVLFVGRLFSTPNLSLCARVCECVESCAREYRTAVTVGANIVTSCRCRKGSSATQHLIEKRKGNPVAQATESIAG